MTRPKIPIGSQIAEVKRELALRENTYPKLIAAGKLSESSADLCNDRMKAVLVTLLFNQENEADFRVWQRERRERQAEAAARDPRQIDIEDLTGGRR